MVWQFSPKWHQWCYLSTCIGRAFNRRRVMRMGETWLRRGFLSPGQPHGQLLLTARSSAARTPRRCYCNSANLLQLPDWKGNVLRTQYLISKCIRIQSITHSYIGLGYTGIRAHTGPRISVPQIQLTVCFVQSGIRIYRICYIPVHRTLNLNPNQSGIRAIDCTSSWSW